MIDAQEEALLTREVSSSKASSLEVEIRKTYKYRIYPDKTQQERLEEVLGICQKLYNAGLEEWRETYRLWRQRNKGIGYTLHDNGVAVISPEMLNPQLSATELQPPSINYYTQSAALSKLKEDVPELKSIYDKILRDVLRRLDRTHQAFFRRVKNGEKAGYPRYKSWHRYHSFTYPTAALEKSEGLGKAPGWYFEHNKLTLQMGVGTAPVGPIRIKLHRPVLGRVRTLTIARKGTEWYACFAVTQTKNLQKQVIKPEEAITSVAVGLGLETYATLSNGQTIPNPNFYQRSKVALHKAQNVLNRKNEARRQTKIRETRDNCRNIKNSRNRLQKIHCHLANQRQDFLHKLSRQLVEQFECIIFAQWDIKAMVKRPEASLDKERSLEQGQEVYGLNGQTIQKNYNRAILDAAWGTLISYTSYKAVEAGRLCLTPDPAQSSQTCFNCDWQPEQAFEPGEREFECSRCGLKLPRNYNTALNLLKKQFGANCADLAALREQLNLQKITWSAILAGTG